MVSVISTRRTPAFAIARAASSPASGEPVRMTATSRSSEKIRTRSRRSTSGRCETAIASIVPVVRLSLDEEHPRGRAVAAGDLDRRAHELVDARRDASQIEPLDDHDPRAEQRVVDGVARLLRPLRLDREVIDADQLHATRDAPACRGGIDGDEVACELGRRIAPELAVARLEEDALYAVRHTRAFEPRVVDVRGAVVIDHEAVTDERVERQPLHGPAAVDEVQRWAGVGARVVAERDRRDARGSALRA